MPVRVLAISIFLMLSGCSGNEGDNSTAAAGDEEPQHVWDEQVKTIDKARQLEQDMNDAFRRRAEEVDTQSR